MVLIPSGNPNHAGNEQRPWSAGSSTAPRGPALGRRPWVTLTAESNTAPRSPRNKNGSPSACWGSTPQTFHTRAQRKMLDWHAGVLADPTSPAARKLCPAVLPDEDATGVLSRTGLCGPYLAPMLCLAWFSKETTGSIPSTVFPVRLNSGPEVNWQQTGSSGIRSKTSHR